MKNITTKYNNSYPQSIKKKERKGKPCIIRCSLHTLVVSSTHPARSSSLPMDAVISYSSRVHASDPGCLQVEGSSLLWSNRVGCWWRHPVWRLLDWYLLPLKILIWCRDVFRFAICSFEFSWSCLIGGGIEWQQSWKWK